MEDSVGPSVHHCEPNRNTDYTDIHGPQMTDYIGNPLTVPLGPPSD